jgi:hypothetical protein
MVTVFLELTEFSVQIAMDARAARGPCTFGSRRIFRSSVSAIHADFVRGLALAWVAETFVDVGRGGARHGGEWVCLDAFLAMAAFDVRVVGLTWDFVDRVGLEC